MYDSRFISAPYLEALFAGLHTQARPFYAFLAGLPKEVVSRAKKILEELEAGGSYIPPREEREQVSLDAIGEAEVLDALRRAQPDTMSPIEAMQLLYDLKKKLPN